VIRCSTITLLAHSMPGAGVVHYINRVVLAAGRLLPVYPEKQTFAVSEGMSQMGQFRTQESHSCSSLISGAIFGDCIFKRAMVLHRGAR
jgi:hypothetical protein